MWTTCSLCSSPLACCCREGSSRTAPATASCKSSEPLTRSVNDGRCKELSRGNHFAVFCHDFSWTSKTVGVHLWKSPSSVCSPVCLCSEVGGQRSPTTFTKGKRQPLQQRNQTKVALFSSSIWKIHAEVVSYYSRCYASARTRVIFWFWFWFEVQAVYEKIYFPFFLGYVSNCMNLLMFFLVCIIERWWINRNIPRTPFILVKVLNWDITVSKI